MADELTVTREVVLDATPHDLWAVLTDPDDLAAWLGDEVRLDPVPGGMARVVDGDGTVRIGRVDRVEVGRRLQLTWWPAGDETSASTVSFTLAEEEAGTRLTVVEAPVAGGGGGGARCAVADAGAAWDGRLVDLELRLITRPVPSSALA